MKKLSIICVLVLYAAGPTRLSAQATDCNEPLVSPEANAIAQQQWENRSSPVYAEATNIARELTSRGIKVECLRRSKDESLFKNQKGAAWFKSDQGIFEVWFTPDAKAAGAVIATVTATPAPVSLPSGPNEFFIRHLNMVFHVSLGDRMLAIRLQRALQTP